MLSQQIAQIVKYCRKQSGLSQADLAQLAGVGKTVVFDIEHGKASVRFSTLVKVLEVLNIQLRFQTPFVIPMEDK